MLVDVDMRLLARRALAYAARLLGLDDGQFRIAWDCDGSMLNHEPGVCFGHVDIGVDPSTLHLNPAAPAEHVEGTISHELYHAWRAVLGLPKIAAADEELAAEAFVEYARIHRSYHP